MTRYAFSFDSSACSGCKACQVACKDKHNLPVGMLWRRVYEVTGGGWTRRGNAWVSDVFAYHISLACNHCERPICVKVCPAKAITQRADGIVRIDGDRCLGCRYCSWACPYNAPQYDAGTGRMQKCDLCVDDLDRGKPPACVAGCPLRALELMTDYSANGGAAIFPLPEAGLTSPALVVKPHLQAARAEQDSAMLVQLAVAVVPPPRDFSLVAFTILAQMAVGASWVVFALQFLSVSNALSGRIGIAVVGSMALALLASLFHLGAPANAWRALANWRSSWLSREIMFALAFTAASALFAALVWLQPDVSAAAALLAALAGIVLIYCMASAYRLRTVPAWNTPFVLKSFALTALLLGTSGVAAIMAGERQAAGLRLPFVLVVSAIAVVEWVAIWFWYSAMLEIARWNSLALKTRWLLSFFGIIAFSLALFGLDTRVAFAVGFALFLSSEFVGRYLFYQTRVREALF